jgi:magnesium-transporting ATPase (P-type)
MIAVCVECGNVFDKKGATKTCGETCSRQRKLNQYRKRSQKWLKNPENRKRHRELGRNRYKNSENRELILKRSKEFYNSKKETESLKVLLSLT